MDLNRCRHRRGGGVMQLPMSFSEMVAETLCGSRWNFAILQKKKWKIEKIEVNKPSLVKAFDKKWPSQVRSQSYGVIRAQTSEWSFTEVVFSPTCLLHLLAPIDWSGDIIRHLGHKMTTSGLWHCLLTLRRSSEITDLGFPVLTMAELTSLEFLGVLRQNMCSFFI